MNGVFCDNNRDCTTITVEYLNHFLTLDVFEYYWFTFKIDLNNDTYHSIVDDKTYSKLQKKTWRFWR